MNLTKEMRPSFDKVTSITDSEVFVQRFCVKALELMEEFKAKYSEAIIAREMNDLGSITHKISSTMKWLDLEEFMSLTESYKELTNSDKSATEKLLGEVMHYSNVIEEAIQSKLDEL
jgi:hypothetical protein